MVYSVFSCFLVVRGILRGIWWNSGIYDVSNSRTCRYSCAWKHVDVRFVESRKPELMLLSTEDSLNSPVILLESLPSRVD